MNSTLNRVVSPYLGQDNFLSPQLFGKIVEHLRIPSLYISKISYDSAYSAYSVSELTVLKESSGRLKPVSKTSLLTQQLRVVPGLTRKISHKYLLFQLPGYRAPILL